MAIFTNRPVKLGEGPVGELQTVRATFFKFEMCLVLCCLCVWPPCHRTTYFFFYHPGSSFQWRSLHPCQLVALCAHRETVVEFRRVVASVLPVLQYVCIISAAVPSHVMKPCDMLSVCDRCVAIR